MKKLSTAACVALAVTLAGCMAPPPSQQENIQQAEQMNANQIDAAKQAHSMCIEFGAKPGTRMFYDCMKEQTEAAEYNIAVASCKSQGYSRQARRECLRSGAGLFGLRGCLAKKEDDCEKSARLAYLPDSNAQKVEQYYHGYEHSYTHTYAPNANP